MVNFSPNENREYLLLISAITYFYPNINIVGEFIAQRKLRILIYYLDIKSLNHFSPNENREYYYLVISKVESIFLSRFQKKNIGNRVSVSITRAQWNYESIMNWLQLNGILEYSSFHFTRFVLFENLTLCRFHARGNEPHHT